MKLEIVNSFLDMKTNLLFFISLTMVILVGCKKPRSVEQQILSIENPKLNPSKRVVVDTIPLFVEDEEPSAILEQPKVEEPVYSHTSHSSATYEDYSSDDYSSSYDDDYWEEKRKTSPNDNYLLGFDEDVDDVHDMEIYMEDY